MSGTPQDQTAGPFEPEPSQQHTFDSFMHTLEAIDPGEEDRTCGICRRDYIAASQNPSDSDDDDCAHPSKLPTCGHIYGLECIREWMSREGGGANSCPTCRRELFPPWPSFHLQFTERVMQNEVVRFIDDIAGGRQDVRDRLLDFFGRYVRHWEQTGGEG